ncbi:polysaccharide pyruvyl transferase family protein [Oenococcus oeni]|uniref:polysaccharide pyruvyl transferase family protein n=1 Tax=Oenococcus oeni TaxID=1247 RepID=UPI0010BC727D|nr:polysaccharide pyruvyl transferase family protein [Oenococcus oeni]SYW09687.1 putative Polysaccharide pyruvyl transferase family protein [Oenococcus oeni]
MEILVDGYWQRNLGDDIFLKIICEKYPKIKFKTFMTRTNSFLTEEKNLEIKRYSNGFLWRALNRLVLVLGLANRKIIAASQADAVVEIGGSIFMLAGDGKLQQVEKIRRRILQKNSDYFVIGSNFGPYFSSRQLDFYTNFFHAISGTYFRDRNSYELFAGQDNIGLAPDVVLGLDAEKYQIRKTGNQKIIISVIDCCQKSKAPGGEYLSELQQIYVCQIANIANRFVNKGYEVVLFSFCEVEGDLRAAREILSYLRKTFPRAANKVTIYNHESVDQSLRIISTADYVVATRFHAMVLGWVFQIPTYVISYSRKTTDVIDYVWPGQKYVDIRNLQDLDFKEAFSSRAIPDDRLARAKKESQLQFTFLDNFIAKENN